MDASDDKQTRYGREMDGNPYLLDRPEIVIGHWETWTVIAAEIYIRLTLGVITAIFVFFMMVRSYAEHPERLGYFGLEPTDLYWRLVPFLAGAAVALFPHLFHVLVTREIESRM